MELQLRPSDARLHSALLFDLHYDPDLEPAELFEEHRAWADRHATFGTEPLSAHANSVSTDRCLRIGYISADFREHTRARFIRSFIENHDQSAYEVFCYCDVAKPDALTERFQQHADAWRTTIGMSDDELASLIRQDRIDILVDLTGHMSGNRLLVFARKPAPVQVCYPGYPDTTGLSTIDYCIGAEHVDAPGSERFFTEKLIRLSPSSQCYTPTDDRTLAQITPP
jgi:predicted O-linked N-acetylglucosamine transferase (SPINDLY family)